MPHISQKERIMTKPEFRAELEKAMPGYKWTVHKTKTPDTPDYLLATGTQSSGFNRLSTLQVARRQNQGFDPKYTVRSSGFGKNAPWLGEYQDGTLLRALRGLQSSYEWWASQYSGHAGALEIARKPRKEIEVGND